MKTLIYLLLAAPLAAQTIFTVPQGYTKLTVAGADAPGENKLTSISATLLNDVEFSGQVALGAYTSDPPPSESGLQAATVSSVTWTENQFTNEPHLAYISVADDAGNADGLPPAEQAFLIKAHTQAGGLTLFCNYDLLGNFPANTTIKIRKANTLSSIFLSGEANISTEDRVFLLSEESGQWESFNFIPSTPGIWLGPNGVATNMVVFPEEGLFYQRTADSDIVLTHFGEVPTAPQIASISGTGFMSNRIPINTQVQDLGIANASWQSEDRLYVWNLVGKLPGESGWDSYSFIPATPGIWLKGGSIANTDVITAGSAVFIVRQTELGAGQADITTPLTYDPNAE